MFKSIRRFFRQDINDIIRNALRKDYKRFLIVWNRGLGDIALGLYGYVKKIRDSIPDVEITFLTRADLVEAFLLIDVDTIPVPWWKRGDRLDSSHIKETIERMGLKDRFDVVVEKPDPTKDLVEQIGVITPRLRWQNSYDEAYKRFEGELQTAHRAVVGVHVNTETDRFYGYRKDWQKEKWERLFERLNRDGFGVVLFGLQNMEGFSGRGVIDLRGKTSLIECLSIIKNRCNALIAPDGGILTLTYYLDAESPLLLVSLWSDSEQGILKQSVDSPNPNLRHTPIIGTKGDISNIDVDEVYRAIITNLSSPYSC